MWGFASVRMAHVEARRRRTRSPAVVTDGARCPTSDSMTESWMDSLMSCPVEYGDWEKSVRGMGEALWLIGSKEIWGDL